jgi:hypothetical protein
LVKREESRDRYPKVKETKSWIEKARYLPRMFADSERTLFLPRFSSVADDLLDKPTSSVVVTCQFYTFSILEQNFDYDKCLNGKEICLYSMILFDELDTGIWVCGENLVGGEHVAYKVILPCKPI